MYIKKQVTEMCYFMVLIVCFHVVNERFCLYATHLQTIHFDARIHFAYTYTYTDYSDNSDLCVTASLYKAHCFSHVGCPTYPLVKSAQFSLFSICHLSFVVVRVVFFRRSLSLNRVAKWRALQFDHFKFRAYKSCTE